MTKPDNSKWEKRLIALRQYASQTGHARVPANLVIKMGGEEIRLGSWVSYLRGRYHRRFLEPEKIQELEAIAGWEWGPLRPGPHTDEERDSRIKELRERGQSLQEIGRMFGLSRQRIHQIVTGNNYEPRN